MQSYEEVGGYGVGDYYGMQGASGGYDASGFGGSASGYGGGEGFAPKRGGGGGFRGGARGGGMSRGAGGMRGNSFSGGPRGGARGGARGGGMSRGGMSRGGGGGGAMRGGRPMRSRGAGQRFNPMASSGGSGFGAAVAGHVVFAYNIGPQTGEEDVQQLFSLYGTVAKVDVIWDHEKNMGKGYAFVTMPDYDEATNAIQQLNGYNYAGKPLQVSFKSAKQ